MAVVPLQDPENEPSEHLGYDRLDPAAHGSGNSRNGTRAKTVLTDACGAVEIDVPRDRAGTVEPQIVKSVNAASPMSTRWCWLIPG